MLSVNLCGHLIPARRILHTHHLFLDKIPNFYGILKIRRFPNSISCLLQSIEQNPQTVKDSLDNEDQEQEQEQEEEVDLFSVNYLINACGLSEKDAIYGAKRLKLRNKRLSERDWVANADVVLAILREHGFTPAQIVLAVKKLPFILASHPYETILPKLEFLQSIGYECGGSGSLGELVSKDPQVLATSVQNRLIPNYNILKDILDSNDKLIHTAIRRSSKFIREDLSRTLVPNVEVLKDVGVPKPRIDYLLVNFPNTIAENHSRFREAVIRVKEMGFEPTRNNFLIALTCFSRMTQKILWEQCYEIFTELGCSSDEIMWAFKKRPSCMGVSEEKIYKVMEEKMYKVMDWVVNKMGWPSDDITKNPLLFRFSLEKRIIPRCSVLLFLHSKGLIEKLPKLSYALEMSVDKFIMMYVTKYAEEVPEVQQIYEGELIFLGQ